MKAIYQTALVSIIPFLGTLPASAEEPDTPEAVAAAVSKGSNPAWLASKLIGTDLKNSAKESIGDIEDVVLDLKTGEILGVVVSTGGFLGIADTLSAVPATALRYDAEAKAFHTSLTKEQVGKAPQMKAGEWSEDTQATVAPKLRAMRDAIGGDVSAPDNTAQNEKDMDEKTLTPVDQGNSEADLKATKDIRAALIRSDLSFNAKNIKIITSEEVVTLRGVVESKDEHAAILKIAKENAGSAKITDDLKTK